MRLQPAIPFDELTDFGALVPVGRMARRATGGGRRRKRGRDRGTLTRKARPEAADPREGRRRGGGFLDALPGLVPSPNNNKATRRWLTRMAKREALAFSHPRCELASGLPKIEFTQSSLVGHEHRWGVLMTRRRPNGHSSTAS